MYSIRQKTFKTNDVEENITFIFCRRTFFKSRAELFLFASK